VKAAHRHRQRAAVPLEQDAREMAVGGFVRAGILIEQDDLDRAIEVDRLFEEPTKLDGGPGRDGKDSHHPVAFGLHGIAHGVSHDDLARPHRATERVGLHREVEKAAE
jgi:hypothetical protein